MSTEIIIGAWVAVGLTLLMYSFLYKDNPFFKLGEHIYVGVSLGYTIVRIIFDNMIKDLYAPLIHEGKYWLIIPAMLGLLMLTRFIPRALWLSRWSFAFVVGVGSGMAIPRIISSFILQQVQASLIPFVSNRGGNIGVSWGNLNSILILIGVTAVLFYFFFSIEHKGAVNVMARTGIYFLMVSFGAGFGYTVMARMSLLIGRFDDLITYSSKNFGYPTIILLGLIIFGLWYWQKQNIDKPEGNS